MATPENNQQGTDSTKDAKDAAAAAAATAAAAAKGADAEDDESDGDDADEDKDWKAETDAQKRINRQLERRTKADQKKIEDLERRLQGGASASAGDEPKVDVEKIRKEDTAEVTSKANQQIISAKAEAAFAGKVHDPAAAVRLIADKLALVEVDADGKVDQEALEDLVAEFIDTKPYFVIAQGTQRFQGTADQGARKADPKAAEQQLRDQIAEAEKSRNFPLAIQLKQNLASLEAAKKKG